MFEKWLPLWLRQYQSSWLAGDITAGVVVTFMLVPQSLAYALLAGLPPQVGLYASLLPIVVYALFGSSMTMAVGPVAIASLMTASALSPLAPIGSPEYLFLAAQLALLSGGFLLLFAIFKMGFLANFLSQPVISGFISGSAVLIALSQIKPLLGLPTMANTHLAHGAQSSTWQTLVNLSSSMSSTHIVTATLGIGSLLLLLWSRKGLGRCLVLIGLPEKYAHLSGKLAPMLVVIAGTLIVTWGQLDTSANGVAVVGSVPQGLPSLQLLLPSWEQLKPLLLPSLLIALVSFVQSVSMAQSLALQREQRINPNLELRGLGLANIASAFSGGYPVAGALARSGVNLAAGAATPLSALISAALMALVVSVMTGVLFHLPHAVLAATILAAVFGLVDTATLRSAWHYDKADAVSLLATAAGVIVWGVEAGIVAGMTLSLGTLVWRSSHPHVAVVGRVKGTQHYRNIYRHSTETLPQLLAIRVDESLFFANSTALQEKIEVLANEHRGVTHLVLVCSAVNQIDTTALGMLTQLEQHLQRNHIQLMLADVKGPVMDRLRRTDLGKRLKDHVFLSAHAAFEYVSALAN
jgi:sulfate permease, SulP family